MKNRNLNNTDNWMTPPDFYNKLNKEFNFDFDPCPYNTDKIQPDKDGLLIEWGGVNFINPPYSRKLKEAFVKKGIEESKKGKKCVFLLPVSTSTKLFHEYILPNISEPIRFIKGRLPFIGINTKGEYVNFHLIEKTDDKHIHVKNSGMHDSMIVIF